MKHNTLYFKKIFRLIFTLFSLYIIGDIFYRWDGVRYYASFSEFLPSISLVSILWSIIALLVSTILWITIRLLSLILRRNLGIGSLFLFFSSLTVLTVSLYSGKSYLFKHLDLTHQLKFILIFLVSLFSVLPAWLLRNSSEKIIDAINEKITPLVWLFSIFIIFSVPFVAYHALLNAPDKTIVQETSRTAIPDKKRPNIILVTFDALTARNMSAYGYDRPTTPFIAKWTEKASLFTNVKAGSNYTTPTTTSLMTSKRLWTHQTYFVETVSKYVKENAEESLPFVLKKFGYSNIALQQIHRASVKKMGISNSFDIILGPDKFNYSTNTYNYLDKWLYGLFGEKIMLYDWIIKEDFILFKSLNKLLSNSSVTTQQPEKAFNKFMEIIDDNFPQPFFAWIHVFPPHDPYLPPQPFKGMFNSSQELRTWKQQIHPDRHVDQDIYKDRYDEFIRYCDKQFEDFIEQLNQKNLMEKSIVILSADHGESFSHNYKGHGGPHLYEQLTHIPLIIKDTTQDKGRIINDLTEQIDIPATILELAHIPVPSWMEGRSLVPLLKGKKLPAKTVFSMNMEHNPSGIDIKKGTIALWEGNYKLIHYLESDKSLLFDLDNDPDELTDLFYKEHNIGKKMLLLIKKNLQKANKKIKDG